MTDTGRSAQTGIAEALGDLSEQTRLLVREEMGAARQEMWDKAKQATPALGLAGGAGLLGLLTVASAYRWFLRVLERIFGPGLAAFLATAGFGATAALAATRAAGRLRQLPSLFPTATVEQASADLRQAATGPETSGPATSGPATPPGPQPS